MQASDKRPFSVDRLKIAKPCPASWDDMEGDERSRLCGLCGLQVYNFAALSQAEIEALIEARRGQRVCAMLFRRADGTVLTRDCPVGQVRVTRRRRLIAAAAGLVSMLWAWLGLRDDRSPRLESSSSTLPDTAVSSNPVDDLDAETLKLLGSLGYVE